MIWFTSDWHLLHRKEFIFQTRGFETCNDMNNTIISNFNSLVSQEDDVYVLGDLLLGGAENIDKGLELIAGFNGRLHIVRGNHDTDKRWEKYKTLPNIVEQENAIYLKYNKYHFYLSHYPSMTTNFDLDKPLKQRLLNLAGHTHTKDKLQDMKYGCYHVELDCHNMFPVSLEEIIKDIKTYVDNLSI